VTRGSAQVASYQQQLTRAYEKLSKALKAEADFKRGADAAELAELRELRRVVDSASQAYAETMRQYVGAFEEITRGPT
jgi:hypothetical protein